ncbi:ABC transporter substrate-binding protein [Pontivivens ytuae]|uniref:ABC transporter substrate-binding protein n=2 Tax=Pontivivens ytuae TaxID=2789856 RepID=A0A7S9QEW1_9RHOB|nr:ABC transporter substrate-binding protein [Pontivivens ytuae]
MTRLILACAMLLALPAWAQTRVFTDHLERTVEIPVDPQRVVSLGSKNVTVPMIELGVMPVGSQGTMPESGEPTIRASGIATGVDFHNSDIVYIGDFPVDLELIASLAPDLIVWPDWQDEVSLDQLSLIAPTVAYETDATLHDAQAFFAELFGRHERLAANRARYDAQIAQLSGLIPAGTTYSVLHGREGEFWTCKPYGNLELILQDAGLDPSSIIAEAESGACPRFSAERLQDFDADWIFTTYRTDRGETPQDALAGLEDVFPGFCNALTACREGRHIVLPREELTTPSYDAVGAAIFALTTLLSNPYAQPDMGSAGGTRP